MIRGAHHQMQIVGDHQHAATVTVAQAGDQAVQLSLAGHVDTLYRLIEYQQFRFAQQGPGQQHALHFATGNALHRAVDDLFGADFLECCQGHRTVYARHQTQKAQYRQRQGRVDMEFLRHVADPQFRLAPDAAAVRFQQAEHGTYQCGFAGAVGADQCHDLPRLDTQLNVVQHRLPGERDGNLL
ncbi:hypothetical protein D9M71_232440 [compost metagenome]